MTSGFRILPALSPPDALLGAVAAQAVSHLSDSMGCAQTVSALDLARAGDVIVVDACGALETAIVGELIVGYAGRRGIAGLVIDGAIRDVDHFASQRLPVYARGISPRDRRDSDRRDQCGRGSRGHGRGPGRHHLRRRRRAGGRAAGRWSTVLEAAHTLQSREAETFARMEALAAGAAPGLHETLFARLRNMA